MKVTALFLFGFTAISGIAMVSLTAAADCWMTCPPGSATSEAAVQQPPTAEPVASSPEREPITKAKVTDKKSEPAHETATTPPAGTTSSPAKAESGSTPEEEATPVHTKEATKATTARSAAPTQRGIVQQAPHPAAAFQPAPVQEAVPAAASVPGPIPGTATMRVIPE
jgi:hypothetical protein